MTDTNENIQIGIIGGSGYIGAELLRYLVVHPHAVIRWVTANTKVGEEIAELQPNLRGCLDQRFVSLDEARERLPAGDDAVDVVFVALPHNKSQEVIPELAEKYPRVRFIDMAGDFRTADAAGYERFYGKPHEAPEWLERFSYGFTEFQRPQLREARLVANPGCFATALLVALSPLARLGKLGGEVFASAVTGSSGSGNVPKPTTHHPERGTNFRSYKPLSHQHLLEVNAFLRTLTERDYHLNFVPHSGPFVRGVFATVFTPGIGVDELETIYGDAYRDEALIFVRRGSPDLRVVQGTPRTEVGVAGDAQRGVVFVALDNLGKGAAGQALQNLNCLFGLDETTGLRWPGGFV